MKEAWRVLSHPSTPHSTPSTSNVSSTKSSRASLRPPIFNPYDKFTQPEFDAWIGDITSSIKRALHRDVEPDVELPSPRSGPWKTLPHDIGGNLTTEKRPQSPALTEPNDEQSVLEDSFAHITSRKSKGKARDPREGPGLGLKDQPIELLSESDEEEVVDNLEGDADLSESSENLDDGAWEGSFEETGHPASETTESGEGGPRRPGESTYHSASLLSREESGHVQEVANYSDAGVLDTGDEDDLRLLEDTKPHCENEIDSGAEGFSVQGGRGGRSDTEDDSLHLSQCAASIDVELVDPWDGPRTFAEDYYSGGDRLVPGLTPSHLTPVARSPVPTTAASLSPKPSTNANADSSTIPLSVSSTSSSPQSQTTVDVASVNAASSQHGVASATSVNTKLDELESESYYDHLEANDVTVHTVEDTEYNVVETAKVADFMKPTSVAKRDLISGEPGSEQDREIILVPFSDDEHTDGDGEDDGGFSAIQLLGTSDLDIGDDWGTTGRPNGVIDPSDDDEEDELREEVKPTHTTDDVANTVAQTLTQFSEVVETEGVSGPKVVIADPSTPTLVQTFQLTDAESFGDLPMSSPPSESPSPAADDHAERMQPSIDQLFAALEREIYGGRGQIPTPSTILARESGAESTDNSAYQELEKILLEELPVTENGTDITNLVPAENTASQGEVFYMQRSEYVVEENGIETEVLSVDGSDDTCSIPNLEMAEVMETIQPYEVEEPEDTCSIEVPETANQFSNDEYASITTESVASPVLEYPVFSVSAPQTKASLQAATVPAPIVADPSVPDPVPGDPSPTPPETIHNPIAPRLSIVPPLKASDPEPSQISTGISGLFTPAQRSGVATPVLEDETAEASRTPYGSNNGVMTVSTPPVDNRPPLNEFLIAGVEDGGVAVDQDLVWPDKVPEPLFPNVHQLGPAVLDRVDPQDPNPDAVETDDDISSTPRGGSVEPTVSHSLPTGDTSEALLKYSEHLGVLVAGGKRHPDTDIAEGDEDADGEADPDYPQMDADVTVDSVASEKIGNDARNGEKIVGSLENPPARSPVRTELQAIRENYASPTLQDSSSAPNSRIRDVSAGSEVKAIKESEDSTQALKRKRRYPNPGPTRIVTRSKSGANAVGEKRGRASASRRAGASTQKSKLEQVDASVDSPDDDASEIASVSSGASAVYRLLRPSSRSVSVISSASGDAPWASPPSSRVIPLIHSHGLLLHHHGRPLPPPLALPVPPAGPPKDPRSDQAKAKSPITPSEPSTPILRRSQSINSPVTRSNCRFHKISLPRGVSSQRAHFVVPGCALGDGELMEDEDIKDEGVSTHEDHKRMLPNVENLDLDPYLVGVLRQLVGVDLLREQQEIFYLPSEKERPRKRHQTDALENLRQLRRQSVSGRGPLAREHSPRLSEDCHVRSSPPRSPSGSVMSGSARADNRSYSQEDDSDLSNLDDDDNEPPTKRHKRAAVKEMVPPSPQNAAADEALDVPVTLEQNTPAEKGQSPSSRRPPTTRSKRRALNPDAAAYKPGEGDGDDEDDAVIDTRRRRSSARKATKRSHTMEDTSLPRSKKSRLGRSVSVAGAGVDS